MSGPSTTIARNTYAGVWQTVQNAPHLALHAALYTWPALRIPPGWVLDLGSEYGFGSLLIADTNPDLQVLGIDLDLPGLRYAQSLFARAHSAQVNGSAFQLPVASGRLSGIYMINLLHLLEEPEVVLREARRVLKTSGVAILSIPSGDFEKSVSRRNSMVDKLESEIEALFSEVIHPDEIFGRLPSFPLQSFALDREASPWIVFCRKT